MLLPASPGSFCELGLLTANGDFSPKLLILADATYPRRGSYVADGPLTAASNYRAEVHFVNYNDFEFSWSLVKTRLERIRVEQSMARFGGVKR